MKRQDVLRVLHIFRCENNAAWFLLTRDVGSVLLGRQHTWSFCPPWFGFIKASGNLIELEREVKTHDVTLL